MFVVYAGFRLFVAAGKPLGGVPPLFLAVVVIVGLLGAAVAQTYSDPANQWLRRRWNNGAQRLGAATPAAPARAD